MGLFGVVEARRVELYKLHILDLPFRTIDHSYTISGSDLGVGGGRIDRTRSPSRHERDSAQVGVYLLRLGIEDIGSVALDIGGTACDANT